MPTLPSLLDPKTAHPTLTPSLSPPAPSSLKVCEMQADEKPREKLMRHGAASLSDSELLAILVRTGTRRHNVIDLSRLIMDRSGGLRGLIRRSWLELSQEPGIAAAKAVTLEAAFELARRIQQTPLGERPKIRCPQDAAAFFAPLLRDLKKEVFMVGFLNHSKHLTGSRRISEGGMTATVVDPAEVMRQAILHHASSIVVAHNHPSGSTDESHADRLLTRRIAEAGMLLGIPLNDHIIIAGDAYASFREKGFLS